MSGHAIQNKRVNYIKVAVGFTFKVKNMVTIWKYPLEVTDDQYIEMPSGSKILTVQIQNAIPCLWAMVYPERPKERRHIRMHGTGHLIGDSLRLKYISTFQIQDGALVFHVFEVGV